MDNCSLNLPLRSKKLFLLFNKMIIFALLARIYSEKKTINYSKK